MLCQLDVAISSVIAMLDIAVSQIFMFMYKEKIL